MNFTEEDVPLMRLIFNPSTHEMGMMVGRERAKTIKQYVLKKINLAGVMFVKSMHNYYEVILCNESICNFFWDNNIFQLNLLDGKNIANILAYSPIAQKILDSGKLDLDKLDENDITDILKKSPLAEKIWYSGKFDYLLPELSGYEIYTLITESSLAKKICESKKLHPYMNKLEGSYISSILIESEFCEDIFTNSTIDITKCNDSIYILSILLKSPIAKKIVKSGKVNDCLLNIPKLELIGLLFISPVAKEILESGILDTRINDLTKEDVKKLLDSSNSAKEIWHSDKLNLSLFTESEIEEYNVKFKD